MHKTNEYWSWENFQISLSLSYAFLVLFTLSSLSLELGVS